MVPLTEITPHLELFRTSDDLQLLGPFRYTHYGSLPPENYPQGISMESADRWHLFRAG